MDAQVLNFMAYRSGLMVGLFDLSVSGIVVTGCKAFRKEDRFWFAWPAEKSQDRDGNDQWRNIVTAAEPEEVAEILRIMDEEIGLESPECQKRIRDRIERRRAVRFPSVPN